MLSDTGHDNLWSRTAPEPPPTSALIGEQHADVVVLGGGFTGLSAALHLAEHGLRAVVLEAREVGHGGSGRNVGLVNAGMWIKPNDLVATQGEELGSRLIAALGNGPAIVFELIDRFAIDCEAERNGTLHLAVDQRGYRDLGEREAQWQALGAPVSRLSRSETARFVGSPAFAGALLDKRAGTIQPLAYVRGLARAALAAGAGINTQSPVLGAQQSEGMWTITTPNGSVRAKWVVVATNAYSALVPGFPFAAQQQELTLLPYFQFATVPLPADVASAILPQRQGCWDTRLVMTSFRMDRSGRLIFGSAGSIDRGHLRAQRAFAQRSIRKLFPAAGAVTFQSFWHGQIGMTADSLPKFHNYSERVIGVNGYNGRGIAPGTVFGKAMARLITHDEPMILPETEIGRAPLSAAKTQFYKLGSHLSHMVAGRF